MRLFAYNGIDLTRYIDSNNLFELDLLISNNFIHLTNYSEYKSLKTLLLLLDNKIINYFNQNNSIGDKLFHVFYNNLIPNKIMDLWFNTSIKYNFPLFICECFIFKTFKLAKNIINHNKHFNINYYITEDEINKISLIKNYYWEGFEYSIENTESPEIVNKLKLTLFIIKNFNLNNIDINKLNKKELGEYYNMLLKNIN